jgi:photosystem II stability/assembly factor-like uncharacterized protein
MSYLLAIGTRKGLWLARSDDRRAWALDGPHFSMQDVRACAIDTREGRTRLLVGSRSEHWGPSVFHSDDLGTSWQEPDGGAVRFPPDADAAVKAVWQLQPDTEARPGVVWAGSEPSALWRSTDGGETFTLVRELWDHPDRPSWQPGGGGQALHTVVPHPVDDARVLVAMSTGGVYRTEDEGASWQASNTGIAADFVPDPIPDHDQCVHKVARDPSEPERLFAQNHGGVYRSDDGGKTWTPIGAGLSSDFGFPVVVHPARPRTAWVVPVVAADHRFPPDGALRVWRTSDAGESWAQLSAGLPDGYYAAVMRDAFTADDVADSPGLYLGGRDGSVYASPDAGESWVEVARHLPDVLCVRAAALL